MKKRLSILLAILLSLALVASVEAGGTFSRVKTWTTGETLTASDLNAEFDNIITNATPAGIDDASSDAAAMQATTDPYPAGVASLATSLLGEIHRIRYMLAQITGETYWYIDPDTTIAALNQGRNPAGTVLPYAGSSAPTGYLLCYGQAVSRTTYAALFAIIGETYGAGDSTTTFNVPDLRGRFPLGKDNMGGSSANRVTDTDADTLGGADGDELKNLEHAHTIAHTHTITPVGGAVLGGATSAPWAIAETWTTSAASSANSGNAGSTTQDIMPPFITLNYIIKY